MAALAINGHDQKAHARMLEEGQTPASGEALPLEDSLELLQSGQLVNLACGPNAAPGRILTSGVPSHSAARIAAELGRALGVPSELVLDGKQEDETEIAAAEVLAVNVERSEVVLGFDLPPHGVRSGYPAVIDFTDATGTYYLAGSIVSVFDGKTVGTDQSSGNGHGSRRPRATISVRHASFVQLRRFVRVPVLISPLSLEVQSRPNEWRATRGEIVDLSLGGLGLLVDEPLFEDARVRVTFELPGRFGDLSATGRVVPPPGPAEARAGHHPGARLAHRRGVILDPLSIEDLRNLQRALYRRQVELRRLAEPLSRRPKLGASSMSVAGRAPFWQFWRR